MATPLPPRPYRGIAENSDSWVKPFPQMVDLFNAPLESTSLASSMNLKATRVFLLVGIAAWQSSCNTGPQQDCTRKIKEEIQPGLPLEIAEANLKKCGFKTTADPAKNTLYGDKVVEGNRISERTQVTINLDSDKKVAAVKVTTGLIGS